MSIKRLFITISVLFTLLFPSLAQAQRQERPIVRLIYFLPSDREPQPDIDEKMDKLIKDVQRAYTDIMKGHGFGRKTFRFETDRRGNAVVHHVVGQHTDEHYSNLFYTWSVWEEIDQRFDTSKDFYLTFIDITNEVLDVGNVCGRGGGISHSGKAFIPASGTCFNINVAAHELGHAFGLMHDYRGDAKRILSYIYDGMVTSYCAAEWLDVHRAFNPSQPSANERTTFEMLPPSLASPPNSIRFRFKVTDPEGIHQARLHTKTLSGAATGYLEVVSCEGSNGKPNTTVELVTTNLTPKNKSVSLQVIDMNGNFTQSQDFSVNIASLLPRSRTVSIPDANLAAAVRQEIGNSITTHTMLNLTLLEVRNRGITNLTGLEHAHNLRHLDLGGEYIEVERQVINTNAVSDFSPLSSLAHLAFLNLSSMSISDISSISVLEDLTQLTRLYLSNNNILDISLLADLTQLTHLDLGGNPVSDISPLAGLTQLTYLNMWGASISDISPLADLRRLTRLELGGNPVSDISPLTGLTQLTSLNMWGASISDISPLADLTQLIYLDLSQNSVSDISLLADLTQLTTLGLTNNRILDVSPLVDLNLIGTGWNRTGLYIEGNPLSYTSIYRHIPNMQAKGIEVQFDPRTPITLTKRLGDAQQGKPGKALAAPFVVEVRDEKGIPFAGVPIKFTVTAGGGKVSAANVVSDTTGRAETTLTLGPNLHTNTVSVTAAEIQQPVIFTATTTDNPPPTFRTPTTFSVAENTTAVGTVKATDSDTQDSVTGYTISPIAGEDSARFSITPTGVLSFKMPPDYERPTTTSRSNAYIVLVSATSGTGDRVRTGTTPFIITVTDVDEPPDTPTTPTVVSATATSLIVSWDAPANTGPPLTYEVRYREGNTGRFTDANYNGTQTNFTLNGLKQGKRYQVEVLAKNDEGRSRWAPSGIGIPQASPPIDFPDVALRTKIATALGKASNTPITVVDMLTLTKLEAPNANIQNLTGLEHAHNLTILNLGGEYIQGKGYVNSNAILDFSPLAGLTNLVMLNLTYCSLTDVSFLAGLTQLTQLYIENNPITDVSPVSRLTQLTYLNLSSTSISDVSPLAGLTELRGLNLFLSNSTLSNVSTLSSLTQLTSLTIAGTTVSDISPLAGLTQLTYLYLGNNNISDISALARLTQLTRLYLEDNDISDVSALSDLTQLIMLNLRNNAILDVSPLAGLDLPGTQWDSTGLYIERNPLNYPSINTHIPAMQAKDVEIKYDNRTPTTLVKISGAEQQGRVNTALPLPFVVEVRDQQNRAFAGVPVAFSVAAGDGRLSATTTITDATGRAETHLTLGQTAGTTTINVTATDISQPVQFTATALLSSAPVAIPDVALRTEIALALLKPQNTVLTVSDLLKLTALTANNANIRDLTGLQHAPNLKTLSLDNNRIPDVTPITALTQLTSLSLDDNNISNVATLEVLTQLETLSLNNNNISNITPLAGMTQLQTLSLNNNNISDVAPLEALTQLETLELQGNLLSYPSLHTHIPAIQAGGVTVSIDPRTPTTLVKLSSTHGVAGASLPLIVEVQDENGFGFSGVPVTFTVTAGDGHLSASNLITDTTGRARTSFTLDTTPDNHTVHATAVEVEQPAIFTITTVDTNAPVTVPDTALRSKITETLGKSIGVQLTAGDMLGLTRLEVPNANIQNLTGLEHAHNLATLNLSGEYVSGEGWVNSNNVSDFSPLFGLAQLTTLNLSFSALTDVSFLSDMPQLTWLRLSGNNLSDIAVLSRLTQLTYLDISYMPISDVSPIRGLIQLRGLYLYGTALSDVSALSGLTELTSLGISGTALSDVSALSSLTQLTNLDISGTSASDISALAGMTQLKTLNLNSNDISDVSALSGLTQLTQLHLRYNTILDVSPLVGLKLPGTQWDSTGLYIDRNPLNYASVHTHIPAMQAKGVEVRFDNQAHSALVKTSGDTQEGEVGATLATPLAVKALDPHGTPMTGLSVRFHVIEGGGSLRATTVTTDANGNTQTTLTLGPNPGVNKVRVSATGITYPLTFTATTTELSNPTTGDEVVNVLAEDVNEDGVVDTLDIEAVTAALGEAGENAADVNEDGIVDIADLALVIGVLRNLAGAPVLKAQILSQFTAAEIRYWLDQAQHLDRAVPAYRRAISVLEQLLMLLLPKETALLANYPNPFNPETWIPYQLAKPAEVTLHIYAVNGVLVRTLTLGYRPAGMYQNRSRAVYWDGRNDYGERVASGIYFYTLTAGDFTATRKMLIRK